MRDIDSLEGDQRFKDVVWDILQLHAKKQNDYGSNNDPFANVRASSAFGVPAWIGALIRLNDKVTRLQNFARHKVLKNESAEDSMMDIAVYALIAMILYREEGNGNAQVPQMRPEVGDEGWTYNPMPRL